VADPGIAGGGYYRGRGWRDRRSRARRVGAKRRSAEGAWGGEEGLGRWAPENFSKINVKIAYFSAFLQAEMK